MPQAISRTFWRSLPWMAALLLLALASPAFAQEEDDPPARAAHMSAREGSVVFAPQGEEEWIDLPQNRPLTAGDRIWSDRGARAELQLGTATLHVDSESHLGVSHLDEGNAQFILQQGTVNARVRELASGENFEIDTPNLALRALQPGDYRVDVDPRSGETRVVVASGRAAVFGEGGQAMQLAAGQQGTFSGRALARVNAQRLGQDDFGAWAAARNRAEDQALAARHVPRGVVGATQLDHYGTWSQDATYGSVWYPQVTVQDWAPYRYGHWSWIAPWGWTWIDDAPWGFAPFHYGRWTMIDERWAWVPGHMAPRPVYAPALVAFFGDGGSGVTFTIGSGPGVGWYPLAPGEAWWPWYRTSPRYVAHANHHIDLRAHPRHAHNHRWRQRPHAITAVGQDDFRRGRPVHRQWQRVEPDRVGRARPGVVPQRPDFRRERDARSQPRLQAAPPAMVQPREWARREAPRAV
ncbi:MAG TPA: DUF6600 domain-containing protein, partial [Ramlibacter sp.]|nr:DUF6600 domain-containing protein [Ramlibacter sp.]